MKTPIVIAALAFAGPAAATAAADVFDLGPGLTSLEFVSVGEPGNAADPLNADFVDNLGVVNAAYRIGTFEVTNAQYAAFLNAKADDADPFGLFNINMQNENAGGIVRSGSPGSFDYAAKPGRENSPVNFVSFFDAVRFTNWLHNGQADGDTETGAYTFIDADTIASGRNADARFFVPSENEWYKAAYFQPADQGGDADNYWLYPTRSNTIADNQAANGANYFDGDFAGTGTSQYPFTVDPFLPVGSYTQGASFFGTFDQGGNVAEWNETPFFGDGSEIRVVRGGAFDFPDGPLQSSGRASANGSTEILAIGFRVAAAIDIEQPACPGDTNGDLTVDGADLVTLLANFGQTTNAGAAAGDFDESGVADGADLVTLLANFGVTCG